MGKWIKIWSRLGISCNVSRHPPIRIAHKEDSAIPAKIAVTAKKSLLQRKNGCYSKKQLVTDPKKVVTASEYVVTDLKNIVTAKKVFHFETKTPPMSCVNI